VRVAVIGAGSWGTSVAALAATNVPAVLWARNPELAATMTRQRENPEYLPGCRLPDALEFTADLEEACATADVIALGVPSHGMRSVLEHACPFVRPDVAVVSLAKGVEQHTLLRMSEVASQVLGGPERVAVLTGPNLAREISAGQPAASVVATHDAETGELLQQLFMTSRFRVYTNPDVVGCEIAGALKNVMAIAAGIAAGLGYGDNTKAALITRGLAELARLGVALGGDPLTFAGLAGMGDLVATCTSEQSRNRTVGVELGRGRSVEQITTDMKMVAEGVKTTPAVLALARRARVEMPIAEQVGAVITDGRRPSELVPALMTRQAKSELHGIR